MICGISPTARTTVLQVKKNGQTPLKPNSVLEISLFPFLYDAYENKAAFRQFNASNKTLV